SFGLAVARLGVDGISITTGSILSQATSTWEEYQGVVGYGFHLLEGLDLGASVKYLREQVWQYEGSGIGADVGLLYRLASGAADYSQIGYKNITLGLSFSNALQPEVRLVQDPDRPDQVLRPGLSYLYRPPGTHDQFSLALE